MVRRTSLALALTGLALGATNALAAVAGIFQVTDGPGTTAATTTNIRGMATDASGLVYVAGLARNASNANQGAYWTFNTSTSAMSAAILPNANATSTHSSQANGIGVLANGNVILGAILSGAQADWNSSWAGGDGTSNGWVTRTATGADGTGVITPAGDANQIAIQASGTRFWNLGKFGANARFGYRYDLPGAAPRASTIQRYDTNIGVATADGQVQGVSITGVTVGRGRDATNIQRAYARPTGGPLVDLPGIAGRTDQFAAALAISADGLTAAGNGRWVDGDNTLMPIYWTNSAGIWSSHKLARLIGSTSTGTGRGVSQTGKFVVGSDFIAVNETSVFWDTSLLDGSGNPTAWETLPWLASHGVNVSGWTRLGRTYSAYELPDGTAVIAGDGVTTDGLVRGFIAIIPEPSTGILLAFGGILTLRRRAR